MNNPQGPDFHMYHQFQHCEYRVIFIKSKELFYHIFEVFGYFLLEQSLFLSVVYKDIVSTQNGGDKA